MQGTILPAEPIEPAAGAELHEPVVTAEAAAAPEAIRLPVSPDPLGLLASPDPIRLAAAPEPLGPPALAEPEAQASFLAELIASIDAELDEALGTSAAAEPAPPQAKSLEQHILFDLAGTQYAAHIDHVSEVREPLDPTPVPNVPDWVLGVANLRGEIISVVDLRALLGMQPSGDGGRRWMLVAHARAETLTAGLIVDRVNGIRKLDVAQIREPAAAIDDPVAPYLRGLYGGEGSLLAVLDFDRLLLSPKMREF
jgi:purine-binding chemotaxis protein CheW